MTVDNKPDRLEILVDSSIIRLQNMLSEGLRGLAANPKEFDRRKIFKISTALSLSIGAKVDYIKTNRDNYRAALQDAGYSVGEIETIDLLRKL